jgi:hypothetical protein
MAVILSRIWIKTGRLFHNSIMTASSSLAAGRAAAETFESDRTHHGHPALRCRITAAGMSAAPTATPRIQEQMGLGLGLALGDAHAVAGDQTQLGGLIRMQPDGELGSGHPGECRGTTHQRVERVTGHGADARQAGFDGECRDRRRPGLRAVCCRASASAQSAASSSRTSAVSRYSKPDRSSRLPRTRSTFQPGRASPGGATAPWNDCQVPLALTKVPEVSAKGTDRQQHVGRGAQ